MPIIKTMACRNSRGLQTARIVMAATWGIVCLMILAAPYWADLDHYSVSSILYCFFSPLCHQMPERSFEFFGYKLAVCQRCSGIYLGLFIGSLLLINVDRNEKSRRNYALVACIPLCVDFLLARLNIWSGVAMIRFATGLLFGIISSSLLVRGFVEFLAEAAQQQAAVHQQRIKGVLS